MIINQAEIKEFTQTNTNALNYNLRKDSTAILKNLITEVAELANLDDERVQRRIDAAKRSPYGRIPGLFNLLTSIVLWPVDGRDVSGVMEVKQEIIEKYKFEEELFLDLKAAKGFHTFLSDDHEIIKGQEPDFDEYKMLCLLLAQQLNIPVVDFSLDIDKWKANEDEATKDAQVDFEDAQIELQRYKEMTAA